MALTTDFAVFRIAYLFQFSNRFVPIGKWSIAKKRQEPARSDAPEMRLRTKFCFDFTNPYVSQTQCFVQRVERRTDFMGPKPGTSLLNDRWLNIKKEIWSLRLQLAPAAAATY